MHSSDAATRIFLAPCSTSSTVLTPSQSCSPQAFCSGMLLLIYSCMVAPLSEPSSCSSSQPFYQVCCLPPPLPLLGRESKTPRLVEKQPLGPSHSEQRCPLAYTSAGTGLQPARPAGRAYVVVVGDRSWAVPPEVTLPSFSSSAGEAGKGAVCASYDTQFYIPKARPAILMGCLKRWNSPDVFFGRCCVVSGPGPRSAAGAGTACWAAVPRKLCPLLGPQPAL